MKNAVIALLCLLLLCAGGAAAQPPGTNYDESKVPAYRLPDLLVTSRGETVRTPADWALRRAELLALLESQMFGRAPGQPPEAQFEAVTADRAALGGLAVRKHVTIKLPARTLNLLVYLPAKRTAPAPVFVGLGFLPNQSVSADPGIPLAGAWQLNEQTKAPELRPGEEMSRGAAASRWQAEKVLSRGYGLAVLYYGDIEPDFPGGLKHGVRASFLRPGQGAPSATEWGAIAAWAWGLSRVADYLETDKDVDATRLVLVGHSRLGKTALWAGALDPRFAIVISNDSGEGGAAISRRRFGETVANLNANFPHWFCGNYARYNDREAEMPFDSHMLLALMAPRPLYVASAEEDRWADPKGEFLGALAASPAWEVMGRKGLGADKMPPVGQPVGESVRYHVRPGKHDITAYDWDQYLDFADRHLAGRK